MSEETLDSLLNDDVETEATDLEEAEVETVDDESTEETEAQESDENTESTDETEEGEPSSPDEDDQELTPREKAFLAKANDEKRKRQEVESKLGDKHEPEEVVIPDPVEDPQGYARYLKVEGAKQQLATRISISQELMREKHADYDEKEASFMELAKSDPSLIAQLQQSPNPAKFAYEAAVKAERVAQFDNFDDAVKTEVDKQVTAKTEEIRAELTKEFEAKLKQAQTIPPSGAGAASKGVDSTEAGSESLSDILGE